VTDERALWAQVAAEFERLGLNLDESPYQSFAAERGAAQRFIEGLRRLQPGVTWRDVFPDMPDHWVLGRPETWTRPYHPLGPYDYQELPTGPAVHVQWRKDTPRECLAALLAAARDAGWRVHGGGFIEIGNPGWPTIDAMVILERGTSEETLYQFADWLNGQSGVSVATIPRNVGED
jgi:hypothetical protein